MSHIFIVGFMGAGKSTVGRLLSKRLGLPFVDMDERIEDTVGRDIPAIFAEQGEASFRTAESRVLSALRNETDSVVACGGGVVLADSNRSTLKELGSVVYLRVTPGEALARIGTGRSRPLLADGGVMMAGQLLQARESLYESTADITVNTVGKSREQVAGEAAEALEMDGDE